MKRVIKFKGRTGRWDIPSFLWTENETLTIKLEIAESRVGKYIAVVNCGEQKKTVYLDKDMTIDISPDFLKNGKFNPIYVLLEFRDLRGNRPIIPNDPAKGGFFVEPLYIERVTENTTAIAWLTKIENDIAELKKMQGNINEKLQKFEDEGVPLLAENENE